MEPGGANCRRARAEKDGEPFFVKQFLAPKYPLETSPGLPAGKAERRDKFLAFERYQEEKLRAIRRVAAEDGRLVLPMEQFRHGTSWYTVSPWVQSTGLPLDQIARRGLEARLLIMAAVAVAVRTLHAAEIVHGDLKPANILIGEASGGQFRARLIDFDSSYFDRRPPEPKLVMGDPPYYSPELLSYVQGRVSAAAVTTKSDVFALGLVYCEYLTGALPTGPDYAAEVVRSGEVLRLRGDAAHPQLEPLLRDMLMVEPGRRPVVRHVYGRLRDLVTQGVAPASRLRMRTRRHDDA